MTLSLEQSKFRKDVCNRFSTKSVREFAPKHAALDYVQLAQIIDSNLIPVYLTWLLADEADQDNSIDWFVKDALIRTMRERCPNGWHYGDHADFSTASAIAGWMTVVDYVSPELEIYADRVVEHLKKLAPDEWLPSDINDPIIQQAFEDVTFAQKPL
jgi:hypothetical protein